VILPDAARELAVIDADQLNNGQRGFGSAWGEEAELVAFRVGEDRPRDIALA
jgi:hypothetical protein